jgi:hypothetical protein
VRKVALELKHGYDALVGRTSDFEHQALGRHIDPGGLGGFYCDFRHKVDHTPLGVDTSRDYLGRPKQWVVPVAQKALGYWELWIEGADVDRPFLQCADWLVDHAAEGAGGAIWRVDFPVPKYGLSPGWVSGLGQGEAISVLLRAHLLSGRDRYLETARAALPALLTAVASGGVMNRLDGHVVLEEYPTEQPTAVLNGWIVALFGIHELANVTGNEHARDLFEQSSSGLLALLDRYDIGWWSLYSLHDHGAPDLAKPFYQRFHPVLLRALDLVRPDARLRAMATRWEQQITRTALLRVSSNKVLFRLIRARPSGYSAAQSAVRRVLGRSPRATGRREDERKRN